MLKITMIAGLTGLLLMSTNAAVAVMQSVPANPQASYAKTKYPIVFTHGLFGFNRLGTKEFGLDYFYRILPDLASNGATVFASQVSPVNSNEVRGEQLLQQVEEVLAITGAPKVNLIGHSQGGPTIRYVAGVVPAKVASVTTVAGANKGSKAYDVIAATGLGTAVVAKFAEVFIAPFISTAEGNPDLPANFKAALNSITTEGTMKFNQRFPDGIPTTACGEGEAITKGIYNYSWTGNRVVTNLLDPDTLLNGISSLAFGSTPNDGMIGVCATHFGKVIRNNYPHNHFDEINQVLGLRALLSPDPVEIYRQHANRLKNTGL